MVQDIEAVWLTLLRTLVERYNEKRLRLFEIESGLFSNGRVNYNVADMTVIFINPQYLRC